MKTIKIGKEEYKLEFTFEAAEHKNLLQMMFDILSGAYIVRNGKKDEMVATAMINGVSEMVADIPHISRTAFYAGLQENNPVSEDEAKVLMKQYMKDNKLSFNGLYEFLKSCMEEDGFFDLSGLTEMILKMNQSAEGEEQTEKAKTPKSPQDHQKKSISTK